MKRTLKILAAVLLAAVLLAVPVMALEPDDPRYQDGSQWYLDDINAPAAWDITTGGDIIVAVIDTGFDVTNPDLINNLWTNEKEIPDNGKDDDRNGFIDDVHGWNFGKNSNDVADQTGHGTCVTSILGAEGNNGLDLAGVCWNVKIMPVVITTNPQYSIFETEGIIRAIYYAVDNGAKIINSSNAGSPGYEPELVEEYHKALQYAADHDVLVVVAAGNASSNNDEVPVYTLDSGGNLQNIIAVASTGRDGELASAFSNYGKTTTHIAAPGTDILADTVTKKSTSITINPGDGTTLGIPGMWQENSISGKGLAAFGSQEPVILPEGDGECYFGVIGEYHIPEDTESGITMILTRKPLSEYRSMQELLKDLYVGIPLGENAAMKVGDTIRGEWKLDDYSLTSRGEKYTLSPPVSYQSIRENLGSGTWYPGFIYSSVSDDSWFRFKGMTVTYQYRVTGDIQSNPSSTRGTSFSTPLVSGTAALIWTVNPDLSVAQVKDCILSTVDTSSGLADKVSSGGKLNAGAAVEKAATLVAEKTPAKSPLGIVVILAGIGTAGVLVMRRK